MWIELQAFFESMFRVATPLMLAAMAGLLTERSGVVNIALEGFLLVGAFFAAMVTDLTHSLPLGIGAGVGATVLFSWIYAASVLVLQADQIVAGIAMNLLAFGLLPSICKVIYGVTGATPSLDVHLRLGMETVFFAWVAVALVHVVLRGTRRGLHLRMAGESPESLEAAGVGVLRLRWTSITLSGVLAGLGGASLSMFLASSYSRGMSAGRGFIAISAMILGKWRPIPTALACLFFAGTEAIQTRLQGVTWIDGKPVPVQFIQILPYVITLVVLAGFVGRARAPRSLGRPLSN